jgi:regulator of cell morphogenesis and NO signaling
MFLTSFDISPQASPAELVNADYRMAEVFQRLGIQFCCGTRLPLETVCSGHGLDLTSLMEELRKSTRTIQLPAGLPYERWNIDFLIDYIINIHHYYINENVPALAKELEQFVEEHKKKYPVYSEICREFEILKNDILPHIRHEEESIFPYLRQVAHAYERKDTYARLLVKTLRRPLAKMINDEHEILTRTLHKFRQLTNNYSPPANACTSHKVILFKLRDLDNDLAQHVYLENHVLFPKILDMEKELLASK